MQQGIKQILFPKQQRRHLPFILFFFEVAAGSRLFPPEFCSVKLSLILVQATKNGAEYICGRVTGFRQTEDNRAGILEPVCSTVFLRVNPSSRKKTSLLPPSVHVYTKMGSCEADSSTSAQIEGGGGEDHPTTIWHKSSVGDPHNFAR